MLKVIVTTMSGDRLFGQYLNKPQDLDELMATGMPVELHNVYTVAQMSVQVAPGAISRTTKLANPEFFSKCNPTLRCLISSWYEPSSEVMEHIDAEIAEVEKREEAAKKGVDPLEEMRQRTQGGLGGQIPVVGSLPPGLLEKIRSGDA